VSRFSIIPAGAVLDSRLSLRELSVLAAIGLHTDRHGWCFPSSERLGEMLGVSGQMVRRSIAALEAAGYVQTVARFAEDGGRLSNRVRVLFDSAPPSDALRTPATVEVAPPATLEVAPPATLEVATPATPAVATPATPGVAVTVPLKEPKERKNKAPLAPAGFALPEWVPASEWEGWLEVRRKLRAPNTARALELAIRELDKLRAAGQSPAEVLEQSTARGWRGLFPLKSPQPGSHPHDHDPFARRRGESSSDYSARINAIHDARERAAAGLA